MGSSTKPTDTTIRIVSQPEFLVPISCEMLDLLIDRATKHYDFKCKALASVADDRPNSRNGLLTVWGMHLEVPDPGEQTLGRATYRELDCVLKTLEVEMLRDLPEDKLKMALLLAKSFRNALITANDFASSWQTTVPLELPEPEPSKRPVTLTLEQFRAQRTDDLKYPQGLEIERIDGEYVLTIANEITSSHDLSVLEAKLYDWALDEGYWDPPGYTPTEDSHTQQGANDAV
jgi:hypothetical protein